MFTKENHHTLWQKNHLSTCCAVHYDFHIKTMFGSSLPLVVCRMMHVYACLRIVVSNTYCVLSLFYFHRLVYLMLPVYLNSPFVISAFGLLIDGCLSFCLFLGHYVVCPSIYGCSPPFGIFKHFLR
jgi:hypothetical protein